MNITKHTPPVESTYTVEFTENQLKILGAIIGRLDHDEIERLIQQSSTFGDAHYDRDNDFEHNLFKGICKALGRQLIIISTLPS